MRLDELTRITYNFLSYRNDPVALVEAAMKMLNEYLDHALSFERLAAEESNANLKAQFEKQAQAYRQLATERAARYGLPPPSPPK
jgi:hypothetical protein